MCYYSFIDICVLLVKIRCFRCCLLFWLHRETPSWSIWSIDRHTDTAVPPFPGTPFPPQTMETPQLLCLPAPQYYQVKRAYWGWAKGSNGLGASTPIAPCQLHFRLNNLSCANHRQSAVNECQFSCLRFSYFLWFQNKWLPTDSPPLLFKTNAGYY